MRRVRQIERFSDECHEIQLQQLTQLLDAAKNTEYGKKHGFARLQDINDFKKAVPLVRYEDLRPYIMQMVEGKSDVLWRGVTRNFAQSSGTSDGKSKYVPITKESFSRCHYRGGVDCVALYLAMNPQSRIFDGKAFILGGSYANELHLRKDVVVGDLSANLINNINPLANLVRIPDKQTALMEAAGSCRGKPSAERDQHLRRAVVVSVGDKRSDAQGGCRVNPRRVAQSGSVFPRRHQLQALPQSI